ncbi:MAG TPA: amino acid ABC transporter permease, partial [Methanocorpusculum sp.]|nr:amino acid ABC transporter permease [Methanocorpusculum sp.]
MDAATTLTTNATALSGVSEFLNELWAYIVSEIPFWQDILLPALWDGLIVTLQLVILTAPFGFLLGLLVAVARVYGVKPVRWAAQLYVIFF